MKNVQGPGADALATETSVGGESPISPWPLTPPTPERLEPATTLKRSGQTLADCSATVGDFWAWAFSDLRQNSVRGHLAEYIVAKALGIQLKVRSAWDDHDLALTSLLIPRSSGVRTAARLQVKSSGYIQAWPQRQPSVLNFGGLRRRPFPWSAEQGGFRLGKVKALKADVFVFAIQTTKTHEDYDPLDVDQWEFRVLPAHDVDYDSLGYPALCQKAEAVTFEGLAVAVRVAVRQRIRKCAGALAQLTKARQREDQAEVERWETYVAGLEA